MTCRLWRRWRRRRDEGGDASESIPISHSLSRTRYRAASPYRSAPYPTCRRRTERSAHVISVVVVDAHGWPPPSPPPPPLTPPSFFPYVYKYIRTRSTLSARRLHCDLTYVYAPPSRARCGRACPRCRRQYRYCRSRVYTTPLRPSTTRPAAFV